MDQSTNKFDRDHLHMNIFVFISCAMTDDTNTSVLQEPAREKTIFYF